MFVASAGVDKVCATHNEEVAEIINVASTGVDTVCASDTHLSAQDNGQLFEPSHRKPGWWRSKERSTPDKLGRIATWNVEGVGESYPGKLEQIIRHMITHDIGILCMQETYVPAAPWYISDEGFLMILSGGDSPREYAGVGFIIAPHLRHAVIAFKQTSSRLAVLRSEFTWDALP